MNYVFFDKQFKFVGDGSGVKQVNGDPGQLETLSSGKIVAKKNGYVYVYTSNESKQDVLFDNLGVLDITGPVLEETHYYPFGLTMSGISTTAPLKLEGKRKFNGIEFNHKEFGDGSGLDLYTAKFRGLDPQIGRWWQIDPKPDYDQSPYAAMSNNTIRFKDPLGDTIILNNLGYKTDQYGKDNLVFLKQKGKLVKIGELGKKIDANKIFKNLLNKDITIAKGIINPFTYRSLVKGHGDWDLKNNLNTIYGIANSFDKGKRNKTQFLFEENNYTAENLGNYHYGATGKATWFGSEEFLLRKAGSAQMAAGTSLSQWQKYKIVDSYRSGEFGIPMKVTEKIMLPPYGDDPDDQAMIKQGFNYYLANFTN